MTKKSNYSVVVTRARAQSESFIESLENLGFHTLLLPSLEIEPVELTERDKEILDELHKGNFDWLVLSSQNGINFLRQALGTKSLPQKTKVALQGEKSAQVFYKAFGREPDLIPTEYVAEAVVEQFSNINVEGKSILVATAKQTRGIIPQGLRSLGARVSELVLYHTRTATLDKTALASLLELDPEKLIFTFFSPSSVAHTIKLLGNNYELLQKSKNFTVGPVTSKALLDNGFTVCVEARNHCEQGMLDELRQYL